MNKTTIKLNFSNNACTYDEKAFVQKDMIENLISLISIEKVDNILEIGCGTGLLTEKLLKLYPNAHITSIDISEGMIEIARNKTENKVKFICADIEEFNLKEKYDLIISSATFQWISNIEILIKKLSFNLTDEGALCFATFGKDTFQELDSIINSILKENNIYIERFRDYPSYQELKNILVKCFKENFMLSSQTVKEVHPSSFEFLKSLQKIGANSTDVSEYITPKILKEILSKYDEIYTCSNGVYASYEVFYAICRAAGHESTKSEL